MNQSLLLVKDLINVWTKKRINNGLVTSLYGLKWPLLLFRPPYGLLVSLGWTEVRRIYFFGRLAILLVAAPTAVKTTV